MSRQAFMLFSTFALVAVLVGGCGSSGDSGSLSKQEFVKEAEFICQKEHQRREEVLGEIFKEKPTGSTADFRAEAVFKVIAPYEEATQKLADLGTPEGDEKEVEAIVKAREVTAQRIHADPETALDTSIPFKESDELMEKYGLAKCKV